MKSVLGKEVTHTGRECPPYLLGEVGLHLERVIELHGRAYPSIYFTSRQRAVMTRVYKGWTHSQIANDLKCSEGSVKAVIQQLFRKLGVKKRTQIVMCMASAKILLERQKRGLLMPVSRSSHASD
jgi:DNA-binding NarL/FixJ family response regulator